MFRLDAPDTLVLPTITHIHMSVLPILAGDRLVGRVEPRFDRRTGTLDVLGAWGDTSRLDEALASVASFLGADTIKPWTSKRAPSTKGKSRTRQRAQ